MAKRFSGGWLAGWLGAVIVVVSLVECALIERKYGLFSGGFLVSRYLDNWREIAGFLLGYFSAQLFVALLVWSFIRVVLRVRNPALAAWHFVFFFAVCMAFAMVVKFQLASYFGDAMSFALVKQLGGGSLVDSLKFGLDEGVSTVLAFLVAIFIFGIGSWLISRRRLPASELANILPWRWPVALLACAVVVQGLVVPRMAPDSSLALMRTVAWGGLNTGLSQLTDFDRDGFGLFSSQFDSHPFAAHQHPLALDIPGNGIDEDGIGGDLQLVAIPEPISSFAVKPNPPHVVLVVMESARGDAVGKRLNGQLVTPHLTELANSGSWTHSYSHVGFTVESLKSIFTGALVPHPGSPGLFPELKSAGYSIAVFSGQPEDFGGIAQATGMNKAAGVLVDANVLKDQNALGLSAKGSLRIDEKFLMAAFDEHFGKPQAWASPKFLYFNFQSPHFPYHHAGIPATLLEKPLARDQIVVERKEEVAATYWNSVAYSDRWLGALVDRLKTLGVWDNTVLLVTGDHGEDLFEQGFLGHGHIINQRQNQTFLVASRPGVVPQRPIGLSDYRELLARVLSSSGVPSEPHRPFMYIGSIQRPVQIGMVDAQGRIVSLSTQSLEACFQNGARCQSYDTLNEADWTAVNDVVRRWGSERWKVTNENRLP